MPTWVNEYGVTIESGVALAVDASGHDHDARGRFGKGGTKANIDSPVFKSWFADSKVSNLDGSPLVVYHSTSKEFSEFKEEFISGGFLPQGTGFYFTSTEDYSKIYGGKTFYSYLRNKGWPTGYRVLCHNCNMSLGFYGHCPHQESEVSMGG